MKQGPRPGAGSKGTHASRSEAQPQASIERVSTWAQPHPCSAAALNLVGAPSPEQGEEFRQRRKTRPAPRSWPSEPPRGERPSARRAARQSAATGPRQRVDPAGVHLRSRSAPARLWRFRVRETARAQRGVRPAARGKAQAARPRSSHAPWGAKPSGGLEGGRVRPVAQRPRRIAAPGTGIPVFRGREKCPRS